MKKKHILNILSLILVIFVSVGCSKAEGSNTTTTSKSAETATNGNKNSMDEIDVYGEISEIVGNEITLKLVEKPKMPSQNGQKGGQGGQGGQGTGGGNGGSGGPGGGMMREKKYTGKEKTIVIPVGTTLVTMTRGDNGMTESEIGMNELTNGSMLSIFYMIDGKTIEKIRVQKPRTGGGQGGQGGKFGN